MAQVYAAQRRNEWVLEYRDHRGRRRRETIHARTRREAEGELFIAVPAEMATAVESFWRQLPASLRARRV